MFDWAGFERTLSDVLVQAVASTVAEHPGERFYAAVLDNIYRETDGQIFLPMLGVNSVEALARRTDDDIRWSPPDWDYYAGDWIREDVARHWEQALTVEACRGTTRQWESTFRRYIDLLVRVCRQARVTLRASGVVDQEFVVLLFDDEFGDSERLIKRILSPREVSRHFPDIDERAAELARIAALSDLERAAYLVSRLGVFDGPIDSEEAESALRDLGPAAFPVLIPIVASPDKSWRSAKLLADIGQPDDSVVRALEAALMRTDGANQSWVAAALSRLGRLDLVLDQANELPQDVVVGAVAAPYTSFRDQAATPPQLDYSALAKVIERWPAYVPALAEELQPGRTYCRITIHEVDEAVRGLTSQHAIIRRHAASVLGQRRLGARVARRVLPLLSQAAQSDTDETVRALAGLSLMHWQKTPATAQT